MGKVNEILSGWKNYLLNDDSVDAKLAKHRADQCAKCPEAKRGIHTALLPDYSFAEIQGHYCNVCKCPLSAKVRSAESKCPKGKW